MDTSIHMIYQKKKKKKSQISFSGVSLCKQRQVTWPSPKSCKYSDNWFTNYWHDEGSTPKNTFLHFYHFIFFSIHFIYKEVFLAAGYNVNMSVLTYNWTKKFWKIPLSPYPKVCFCFSTQWSTDVHVSVIISFSFLIQNIFFVFNSVEELLSFFFQCPKYIYRDIWISLLQRLSTAVRSKKDILLHENRDRLDRMVDKHTRMHIYTHKQPHTHTQAQAHTRIYT